MGFKIDFLLEIFGSKSQTVGGIFLGSIWFKVTDGGSHLSFKIAGGGSPFLIQYPGR